MREQVLGAVVFEVVEVLRGDSVPERFAAMGFLVQRDDFNRDSVPYLHVRPAGQRGACFAHEYRLGAEYLLLLAGGERWGGRLTPYWAALQPVNEQVRGADDPWVEWVRTEIRRAAP